MLDYRDYVLKCNKEIFKFIPACPYFSGIIREMKISDIFKDIRYKQHVFKNSDVDINDCYIGLSGLRSCFLKLFGDKGYLGKDLFGQLFVEGVHLVTKIRKNMKNSLMHLHNKTMLKKRTIIETVNDQLKNICQIEHTAQKF